MAENVTGTSILRRTVSRNLARLSAGSALIGLHQLCEAAVPVLIGIIVDRAVATGSVSALIRWIAVLAGLFVVLSLVWRFGARALMFAIEREAHRLRVELSHTVLHPRGIRTDYRTGELLSISSSDADETAYLLDYVPRVVGAVVATAACGAVLLTIDLPLGLMVLVGVPVVVVALQFTAPLIVRRVEDQQAQTGQATALATDLISGLRPLQGIGAAGNAALRYRAASRRSLAAALRVNRIQSAHTGASAAVGALTAMLVAVAAAYFAIQGDLSVGELITVIGLAQFLTEPFSTLALVPSWVAEARASANRVATVLTADPRHPTPGAAAATTGATTGTELDIRGVTHGTLVNLTLRVPAGEFVGVMTADARDAGALIDVLSGHERSPVAGEVRVGGRPVAHLPRGERHTSLLVEPHLGVLFSGTLGSNLTTVEKDWDPHAVADVLEASSAVDVVDLHADGLAHPVLERGANLSGGQRQRWTLARALLADPDVLVLHDPTTAVDTVTEQAIATGIRRLRTARGRTTVVVTSSPALLAAADRVAVIVDGRLLDVDTHRELVRRRSDYRELVAR